MANETAAEVLEFWRTAGHSKWWRKDEKFDADIREKFADLHTKAASKKLDHWREEADSCLALVLILDQFSRNLFRGDAKTFAQDDYGLEVAKYGIENGFDKKVNDEISAFFYLPLMHCEKLDEQEECINLMRAQGVEGSIAAAIEHRDIISRFGRFPHRNTVLGRKTTSEEKAFLDDGGFAG